MKRPVRWAMASLGIAAVVMAVTLAPGGATPPVGLTNVPLASGLNQSYGTIPYRAGTYVAMAQITVGPGGSSGWHSHPGGAVVIVQQGSLTVYASMGDHCHTMTYTAGESFIERSGEVMNVLNTGTGPYVLYVTFPSVPVGASPRTDEPNPGTCSGV
jgi:quercetin dioxygenase-like cupin family protein